MVRQNRPSQPADRPNSFNGVMKRCWNNRWVLTEREIEMLSFVHNRIHFALNCATIPLADFVTTNFRQREGEQPCLTSKTWTGGNLRPKFCARY